jgi:hypothetical protein
MRTVTKREAVFFAPGVPEFVEQLIVYVMSFRHGAVAIGMPLFVAPP